MFHAPATPQKKRRPRGTAAKSECKNNQDVLPSFSLKDEVLEKPGNALSASSKSKKSSKTAGTSSSTARKRQLEYETAKAMALVEIQAAEAEVQAAEAEAKVKSAQAEAAKLKANIQSKLLNKQLAAEMAELESHSRSSHKSAMKSSTSKVENWLNAPGNQHEENREEYSCEKIGLEKLAHALNDAVAASSYKIQNQELLTRLATSKDLPLFFGDPMEWLQFKQAYQESTQLCKYSDTENLWRLRKCLRGDAKEAVTSLLIGGTTPDLIIDTLELRFGKPETIMSKIVLQLKKLCPLPLTYHNDIINFAIKIKNYVAAAKAMQQSDYLRSPELVSIVVSKLPTLLVAKWTDYVYEQRECNLPKLELLSDFLYEEATKTAASGVSHIHAQYNLKKPDERKHRSHSLLYTNSNQLQNAEKCKFCRKWAHGVADCSRFKRALRKDRWRFVRVNKLCFKCLAPRHTNGMSCIGSNCDIDGCNQPHHRLLHWIKPLEESLKTVERSEDEHPSTNETVTHTVASHCHKVLLKVVPLTLHGPNGSLHTHALLDDGATVTVISSDIADELGLYGANVILRARSAWDSGELVCESQVVSVSVTNSYNEMFTFRARKIKELNLPTQKVPNMDFNNYGLLSEDLMLCNCNAKPKLLIGQDNHHLISPIRCVRGKQREPYITQTALGWCVHGYMVSDVNCTDRFVSFINSCTEKAGQSQCIFHLHTVESIASDLSLDNDNDECTCAQLHDAVRRSFALESIGVGSKPRRNPDEIRALQILDDTAELVNGQWNVGLPWKYDELHLPDSYPNAFNRLKSIERKFLLNKEYATRYCERMRYLFSNGYARELNETDENSNKRIIWYLPHFGVDNPNKKKLRLVYDAAAKSNGYSLNDFLLQGPDLLQSLLGIMLRFRENRVGIIGDIKDMFLRINVRKEDVNSLRFLWKDIYLSNENEQLGFGSSNKGSKLPIQHPVKKYVMTSLIFGANCSPFIAQYINQNKNTLRFQNKMPDAVNAIRKNQYMDDFIDSLPDVATATKMIKDVSYINQQGGFVMRNWLSNKSDVLNDMPKETLNDMAIRFNVESQPERTLGLLWFPASDMFGFDLSLKRIPSDILQLSRKPTKREVLRIIMSVYDIHGFLAPFTIKSKILMREIWNVGIKWDQEITDSLFVLFKDWISQLQEMSYVRIPRWYFYSNDSVGVNEKSGHTVNDDETSLQLHIFCDASPCAYACVAYWRKQDSNGVQVSFIASKSRVAPLKPLTMPKLELQGALLACRLAETIKKEHRIKPSRVFYWTDSMIVIYWIRNEHRNYKVFIANRLGEIDELSKIDEWHYVPTNLNIADLATKNNDYDFNKDSSWLTGPSFLYTEEKYWPREPENNEKSNNELLDKIYVVIKSPKENCNSIYDLPIPDPNRFSVWLRLLRCTASVLLFIEKCRKTGTRRINNLLMNRAEVLLLRYSQSQSFQTEIDLLKQNKEINRDSRLRSLTPFLDKDGLLRVGGRINAAANVTETMKNPVILDGKHRIARLVVLDFHVRAAHSYNELVINELRQKYWVVNLRPTVRSVASQCLVCRIRKAAPRPPRLGDLPSQRLVHHQRPFTVCGVDLFGPIEVTVGRQRPKRYGVLFTCLTIRAVHIEIVSTLTADSLIMALRRMAARRGWPHTVISDNGTNMRGADAELRKSFEEIKQQQVIAEALNKGVSWQFIPPASPHMGGAWERLIRSVKTALKVVLRERAPREEVLLTLLAEVENIINSRPLTHVSVDPQSKEALTPNHFLLGSSSNLPVPGVFDDGDMYVRRQWRIAQRLTDLFWSRWVKEFLPELIPRRKWDREGPQLKVGDLVVVVDPSLFRNCWPIGIIEKVYPGSDGRVRVVDVRTKSGVMKRSAARVAFLQLDDECRRTDTWGEDVDDAHVASRISEI